MFTKSSAEGDFSPMCARKRKDRDIQNVNFGTHEEEEEEGALFAIRNTRGKQSHQKQSHKNTACEDTCEAEINRLEYKISIFVLVTNLRLADIQDKVALHPKTFGQRDVCRLV